MRFFTFHHARFAFFYDLQKKDSITLWILIHHREAPEAVVAGQADVAIVYYHLALRYTRIFPDQFDTIPLGGTKTDPEPPPENLIGKIHMGLINDGGPWGVQFIVFIKSETVARIYAKHGLQHRRDVHLATNGD